MRVIRSLGHAVLFALHLAALFALLSLALTTGCTHVGGGGEGHPVEAFHCADCHPGACLNGPLDQRSLSERSRREAREAGDAQASAMQRNEAPGPCSQAEPRRLFGQAPIRERCRCACWSGATSPQDCTDD